MSPLLTDAERLIMQQMQSDFDPYQVSVLNEIGKDYWMRKNLQSQGLGQGSTIEIALPLFSFVNPCEKLPQSDTYPV
jgi:hypothetical protein